MSSLYRFEYIVDSRHAWLKVRADLLERLGIASEISNCSRVSHAARWIYLDKTTDAPTFDRALRSLLGLTESQYLEFMRERTQLKTPAKASLRNYDRYTTTTTERITK